MRALRVSEVNNYIKRILSEDLILSNIEIEGEVSNYKKHYSGHMYFSLKDDGGRIKCVMFKSHGENKDIELVEGQKVVAKGYISIYEKGGEYQLYVKDIRVEGKGDLYRKFEELKSSLEKEGLFDQKYKRELPAMPKKIGLVTSATGAAVKDMINVIKRRQPACHILIYPSLVQGDNAAKNIIEALNYLDKREDIDLIIFGRGGGSIEELFAFNDEELARTIFNLKTPNISAVGHETDFTIADFVSDLRAPTPSAAAELAVADVKHLIGGLDDRKDRLVSQINYYIDYEGKRMDYLLRDLKYNSPIYKLREDIQRVDYLFRDLSDRIRDKILHSSNKLRDLEKKLEILNPSLFLDKGYGLIINKDGEISKDIGSLEINDSISIVMKDATIHATINEIMEGRNL